MGLFGRKKAEQEAAERLKEQEAAEQREQQQRAAEREEKDAANRARVWDWFEALEKQRPAGTTVLTDELLEIVGPFPFPAQAEDGHNGRMLHISQVASVKVAGRMVAQDYEAKAVAAGADDAPFWISVREYCEGVLG